MAKVFKQSVPVIKLPAGATEADHLALLGPAQQFDCLFLYEAGFSQQRWLNRFQGRSEQLIQIAFWSTRAQMRGSRRSAIVILWPSRETRQLCPCGRNPGGAGPLRPWYRFAPRSLAAHLFSSGQLRSVRLVRGSAKTPARSQQLFRPSLKGAVHPGGEWTCVLAPVWQVNRRLGVNLPFGRAGTRFE